MLSTISRKIDRGATDSPGPDIYEAPRAITAQPNGVIQPVTTVALQCSLCKFGRLHDESTPEEQERMRDTLTCPIGHKLRSYEERVPSMTGDPHTNWSVQIWYRKDDGTVGRVSTDGAPRRPGEIAGGRMYPLEDDCPEKQGP